METKKIKIFVDAHCFDIAYQGTQTFIAGLYTPLIRDYPQLDIYFGAYNTDRIKETFPFLDASKILSYKKRKPALLRLIVDIPRFIKLHSFEFAHFQYITPFANARCKYIVTTHDILFNDFKKEFSWSYRNSRNFLFNKSLQNALIKTTVSDYSRNRIIANYKTPLQQIHIIPNAVNELAAININKEKARHAIKEKYGIENFILNVSRIEPRKNHALLLDKFLKLELYKQNISLVFIGKQSIKTPQLNLIMSKLTEEQECFFYYIEQVEEDDLTLFYQSCQLFVYPSKAEGFGIPPLEAAINLAPVLCSNVTAMGEFDFFKPNTFDPNDENEFEAKLNNMIDFPSPCSSLKQIAEAVAKKYSWQKSATKFYDLLQSNME